MPRSLQVSAASRPCTAEAAGPEETAEEGGQEQERPQRHAGGDVHVAAGGRRAGSPAGPQKGGCDLRAGDGRLHGPVNKKVFATFGSRKSALEWARAQATRRGFPPGTAKAVQIVVDGETCLERRLRRLFRGAILTLDIRHAQEKLWEVGRLFHREGSAELTC